MGIFKATDRLSDAHKWKTKITYFVMICVIACLVGYLCLVTTSSKRHILLMAKNLIIDAQKRTHLPDHSVSLTKPYSFNKTSRWYQEELYTCNKSATKNELFLNKERVVHLDLKGAPPKISYFREVFPLFKKMGATGLLIEYEDMFPYTGNLSILRRKHAYSEAEVRDLLKMARDNGLRTIIPLVQTFGHLTFLLKHDKFCELREDIDQPNAIAPGHPSTFSVLKDMIGQVARLHADCKYFHIGSDEVYGMGNGQSAVFMRKRGFTKSDLLMWHVKRIVRHVRRLNYIPIMWDDMFRHTTTTSELKASGLGSAVEIMIWKYSPQPKLELQAEWLEKYAKVFKRAWIGTAFKGGEQLNDYVVDTYSRIQNHINWLQLLRDYEIFFLNNVDITGAVLTGWQRFYHTAPLCELLPVGLPSLAYCLQILKRGCFGVYIHISMSRDVLGCEDPTNLKIYDESLHPNKCNFPGHDVYEGVHMLYRRKKLAGKILNPAEFHRKMKRGLEKIYDNETVNEWLKTYMR